MALDREGSHLRANAEWLAERGIEVTQPKGILLIGRLQLMDTAAKRASFERFRRSLWNPEVLTFDELLARARFLVEQEPPDRSLAPGGASEDFADLDELPF